MGVSPERVNLYFESSWPPIWHEFMRPAELVLSAVAPTMVAIHIDREVTVTVTAEYSTIVSMKMS